MRCWNIDWVWGLTVLSSVVILESGTKCPFCPVFFADFCKRGLLAGSSLSVSNVCEQWLLTGRGRGLSWGLQPNTDKVDRAFTQKTISSGRGEMKKGFVLFPCPAASRPWGRSRLSAQTLPLQKAGQPQAERQQQLLGAPRSTQKQSCGEMNLKYEKKENMRFNLLSMSEQNLNSVSWSPVVLTNHSHLC